MSKLGQALIKGLEDALKYERGEIQLRTTTLSKSDGTNAREANPTGGMKRDATASIGAGETMGKEEKQRVDVEADGKRELDYGKEDLDKNPKKKTKLAARWEEIRKSLDNKTAILDLDSLSEDESEQPENDPGDASSQPNPDDDQDGGDVPDDQEENSGDAHPEWVPEGIEHDDSEEEAPEQEDQGQEPQAEEQPEEGEEEPQEGESDEQGDPEAEAEIEEALKAMGHSDAEIAHIIHGHMVPQVDEVKRAKEQGEYQKQEQGAQEHEKEMSIRDEEADHERQLRMKEREARDKEVEGEAEHAKRMKDLEYQRAQKESGETDLELEHKKRLQDLEFEKEKQNSQFNEAKVESEHKKRMLDLEYENAKAQKALELTFKQKEHEMKLKHAEQLAQEKHKAALDMAKDDAQARKQEKKMDLQQRAVDKKEDLKVSAKQKEDDRKLKSKETAQQRAKAKPAVKKSVDEADDLQKAALGGWKYNPKTQNFNHANPQIGSVGVRPNESGAGFDIVHNGKMVSSHANAGELKEPLANYLARVNRPMAFSGADAPKVQGMDTEQPYFSKPEKFHQRIKNEVADIKAAQPERPVRDVYGDEIKPTLNYGGGNFKPKIVKNDAEASRGEESNDQEAEEPSKGEKSNLADDEKRDKVMQLGVSSVNSHNASKYHGDKEGVK